MKFALDYFFLVKNKERVVVVWEGNGIWKFEFKRALFESEKDALAELLQSLQGVFLVSSKRDQLL